MCLENLQHGLSVAPHVRHPSATTEASLASTSLAFPTVFVAISLLSVTTANTGVFSVTGASGPCFSLPAENPSACL